MDIDRKFVINLEKRKDRKKNIIEELERVKIKDYEIFKGIETTDVEQWNKDFIKDLPLHVTMHNIDGNKYRMGSLGCLMSHYEIIKKCYNDNCNNILIMEDDCIFLFDGTLDNQLKKIKDVNDFGIIYLTATYKKETVKQYNSNLLKVEDALQTSSYIISRKGMKFVMDNIFGFYREVDIFYGCILQKYMDCYCIYPHIANQKEDFSNILNTEVNYNK
jgi:glycosyl transferase, family 25